MSLTTLSEYQHTTLANLASGTSPILTMLNIHEGVSELAHKRNADQILELNELVEAGLLHDATKQLLNEGSVARGHKMYVLSELALSMFPSDEATWVN